MVDDEHRLIDDLRIREILLAPLHQRVRDLIDHQFVALKATDDKKTAVEVFRKYDRTALPVIDDRGRAGRASSPSTTCSTSPRKRPPARSRGSAAWRPSTSRTSSTPLLAMVRKRAAWLVVLFLGEMLTATAMGYFEEEIEQAVVLALFVPLIISSGGNSGSQAATLIIRALALGEVQAARLVAASCAARSPRASCSASSSGRSASCGSRSGASSPTSTAALACSSALTVGLSLVGVVLWGTLCRLDAAVPPQAARVRPGDVVGPVRGDAGRRDRAVIYFTVAYALLRGRLL